jgi:hypothetical protein
MDFSIFFFLLEGLLAVFDIVDFKELWDLQIKKEGFCIYLEEITYCLKTTILTNLPKGFYKCVLMRDFPIKNKAVYLV